MLSTGHWFLFACLFSRGLLTSQWPVPSSGLAAQVEELLPWSGKVTQDSAANTPRAQNLQTLPRVWGGGSVDFKRTRKKTLQNQCTVLRHWLLIICFHLLFQALLHQPKVNNYFFLFLFVSIQQGRDNHLDGHMTVKERYRENTVGWPWRILGIIPDICSPWFIPHIPSEEGKVVLETKNLLLGE